MKICVQFFRVNRRNNLPVVAGRPVAAEQRDSGVARQADFRVAGQLLHAGGVRKQPAVLARTGDGLGSALSARPQGRGN